MDTNVALKAYLEEDLADEADLVLEAGESGDTTLTAPSIILPEFRHSLVRRNRRGELSVDEVEDIWSAFYTGYPIFTTDLEHLMLDAVRVARETGCTIYDALFVVLARSSRDEGAKVVTADRKLLEKLEDTSYARYAQNLADVASIL